MKRRSLLMAGAGFACGLVGHASAAQGYKMLVRVKGLAEPIRHAQIIEVDARHGSDTNGAAIRVGEKVLLDAYDFAGQNVEIISPGFTYLRGANYGDSNWYRHAQSSSQAWPAWPGAAGEDGFRFALPCNEAADFSHLPDLTLGPTATGSIGYNLQAPGMIARFCVMTTRYSKSWSRGSGPCRARRTRRTSVALAVRGAPRAADLPPYETLHYQAMRAANNDSCNNQESYWTTRTFSVPATYEVTG